MRHLLGILLIIIHMSISAQVVNIENKYLDDNTVGFSGALDLSFSIQKQTDALVSLSFKPIFQYRLGPKKVKEPLMFSEDKAHQDSAKVEKDTVIEKRKSIDRTNRHLFLLYHDLNYTASKGKTYSNFGLSHLRYVYSITENWKSESYSQIQYNQLLLQKVRYLLGTGIRANILNLKAKPGGFKDRAIRISAGTSLFFEYNEINHSDRPLEKTGALRWNTYLSTYFSFRYFEFTSTTYIQPNLGDFKDFRSAGDYSILFRISEPFSVKFVFAYYYDARPPKGTPDNTFSFTAGFVYKLNRFKESVRKIQKKYQSDEHREEPQIENPDENYEIIIEDVE